MLQKIFAVALFSMLLGSSAFSQCITGHATSAVRSCCGFFNTQTMVCSGSTGMCNPFGSMISCSSTCSIAVASDDICSLPSTAPKIKLQQTFDFQQLISQPLASNTGCSIDRPAFQAWLKKSGKHLASKSLVSVIWDNL